MGLIHIYPIPIFLDQIPWAINRPYRVMTRPGMAGASVLFHAKQFAPLTLRTISTAPSLTSCADLGNRYLALRRKSVVVDDGIVKAAGTLILDVSSVFSDVGLTIGGNTAGDRYEIATTWTVLLDADLDPR